MTMPYSLAEQDARMRVAEKIGMPSMTRTKWAYWFLPGGSKDAPSAEQMARKYGVTTD